MNKKITIGSRGSKLALIYAQKAKDHIIQNTNIKDEDVKDKSVPTTVNGKKAFEVIETQPGNQYAKGTWWQAFNAVTFNTDHQQGSTTDGRLTSAWYGRNRRVKLKALDTALKMAETV